jgi:ferredoxin--NADP+ reductase
MLGRRGPAQAAFTNAELKEFGDLDGVDVIVDPADLDLDPDSLESMIGDKVANKNVALLREYAARPLRGAPRRIRMRFLVSPVEVIGESGRVVGVKIERNHLLMDDYGGLRAKGTGTFEILDAGLVLRSVGYRSVPLPGVPFDDTTYTITNIAGRVVHSTSGEPLPGEYCVGWAKRGPSGVIGTNKPDAASTVAAMVEDLAELPGIAAGNRDPDRIIAVLRDRKPDFVTFDQWKVLDAHEIAQGAEQGRPRIKVTSVPEMLEVIQQGEPVAR